MYKNATVNVGQYNVFQRVVNGVLIELQTPILKEMAKEMLTIPKIFWNDIESNEKKIIIKPRKETEFAKDVEKFISFQRTKVWNTSSIYKIEKTEEYNIEDKLRIMFKSKDYQEYLSKDFEERFKEFYE